MKIVRLCPVLDFGGIETLFNNTSRWSDDNTWTFVAITTGGNAERTIRNNGKDVYCLGLPCRIPSLRAIWGLWRFFRREKPDVVHASGVEAYVHGIIAAWLAGVPVKVAEEVGMPKHSAQAKAVIRAVLRLADYFIAINSPLVEMFSGQYGVPARKIRLIGSFITETELAPRHSEEGVFRMVSVSRLHPIKNIPAILRVMPALTARHPQVRFSIVGSGPQEEELKAMAQSLGLAGYVEFPGYHSDPYPFLLGADLYLQPSFSEGSSLSLLEAMYAGAPSMATQVGGAPDVIRDGENGWLIDPYDDNGIMEKIDRIVSLSPEERRNVGARGHDTVMENYTLEKYIGNLLAVYTAKHK